MSKSSSSKQVSVKKQLILPIACFTVEVLTEIMKMFKSLHVHWNIQSQNSKCVLRVL